MVNIQGYLLNDLRCVMGGEDSGDDLEKDDFDQVVGKETETAEKSKGEETGKKATEVEPSIPDAPPLPPKETSVGVEAEAVGEEATEVEPSIPDAPPLPPEGDVEVEAEAVGKKATEVEPSIPDAPPLPPEGDMEVEAEAGAKTPLAVDSVIFPAHEEQAAKKVQVGDAVDPITQAIRDEILTKQQFLLQKELAENMTEAKAEDFLKQDLTAIRSYLQSSEGMGAVDDLLESNPDLRDQMHAIERDGYKAVHSKFEKSFHDVEWGKGASNVRTTDVTDADGNPVCTLTETTIDTGAQTATLANGSSHTINSFRKIDFPTELETGNGPMHVSMAVRDADGNNISEKEAVYFTAHYDDSGKLTEVSSPTPVHFTGKGDDAIGYIEVGGKVFTLPVTQGKYQEMMQEIVKDEGLEEELSADKIVVQEKEEEPVLAVEGEEEEPKVEEVEEVEKTEIQVLAEKMKKGHGTNIAAEPKSISGKAAVNVKTGKVAKDIEKPEPEKPEAVKVAEKMKKSRAAKGNEAAEPPSKGGDKSASSLTSSLKEVANGKGVPENVKKITLQIKKNLSNASSLPPSQGPVAANSPKLPPKPKTPSGLGM